MKTNLPNAGARLRIVKALRRARISASARRMTVIADTTPSGDRVFHVVSLPAGPLRIFNTFKESDEK